MATYPFNHFVILAVALVVPLLVGCGNTETVEPKQNAVSSQNKTDVNVIDEKELLAEIEKVAKRVDTFLEDSWLFGAHARILKSGYAHVDPRVKAQFALDYQKMLTASGENLATDIKSYVPYSRRSSFARDWWQKSECARNFESETQKKKIQWIYESLLDASELFWRAFESRYADRVNSAAVLAHDKEQEMVFNYMEDEKTPSSFSDQYVKWLETEKGKKTDGR